MQGSLTARSAGFGVSDRRYSPFARAVGAEPRRRVKRCGSHEPLAVALPHVADQVAFYLHFIVRDAGDTSTHSESDKIVNVGHGAPNVAYAFGGCQ